MSRGSLGCLAATVFVFACNASDVPPQQNGSKSAATPSRSSKKPEDIRRDGNHLMGSASAYLRAHAHNPVDWYGWGPEALTLAVKLDRPIFLSIGYVSCHWCHVMEKEVFERDDVATFLNEHFIAIKVDREERPDLDSVYMEAVESMTGSGGWPMTTFLTPSLKPFFGGTYFPHDRFLAVASAAADEFLGHRNDVENRGADVYRRLSRIDPQPGAATLAADELRALAGAACSDVDPVYGGFKGHTKFPTPIKWRFLLDAFRKWGDPDVAGAVKSTLDRMSAGGIHDQIGGGFFRYATEPTWTVPHFEKMLYDNAELVVLYLEGAAAFGTSQYRDAGLDTLEFLLRDMQLPDGGFGTSFDADTDGKEGATYLFTPKELTTIVGDESARALAKLLGVTEAGNFDGKSIPTMRATPSTNVPSWTLEWRPKLLAARRARPQPAFDPKMVTAWNGLAIGALAVGYRVSGEPRFLTAAKHAADAVWRSNHDGNGELLRASTGGHPGNLAVLDDYADLASGFVDLFEATAEPVHLERAVTLVTTAMQRFASPSGAWFLTSGASQEPLGRRLDVSDGVEPSGNASLLLTLERLSTLTGRTDFEDAANRAITAYADMARSRGVDMSGWLDGALLSAGPTCELVVAADTETNRLTRTWNQLLPPWVEGVRIAANGPTPELEALVPAVAEKRGANGAARAYVCTRGTCKAPTSNAVELRRALLAGWSN